VALLDLYITLLSINASRCKAFVLIFQLWLVPCPDQNCDKLAGSQQPQQSTFQIKLDIESTNRELKYTRRKLKTPTKLLSTASGFVLLLEVVTRASSHPVRSNPVSCIIAVPVDEVLTPAVHIQKIFRLNIRFGTHITMN
jgi:hypothetical protein